MFRKLMQIANSLNAPDCKCSDDDIAEIGSILKASIDELQLFIVEDRKILNDVFRREVIITLVACDTSVGIITLSGKNTDDDVKEDTYNVLERRIAMHPEHSIYLFIIIESLGSESWKSVLKNAIPSTEKCVYYLNGIARIMDYYLDNVLFNTQVMTNLNIRDNMISTDPMVVLAKAYLLYNNKFLKENMFSGIPDGEEDHDIITNYYHFIDGTLFRNLGTDWLVSNDIVLSDKSTVFGPQILLKQEIFDWLRNNELTPEEYQDLFENGGIYKYMREKGYARITEYLNIGGNSFSTEQLNKVWMNCI